MKPRLDPQQKFRNLFSLGKVTSPFGGQTRYEAASPGVDVANAKGTPIPATTDGVVEQVVTGRGPNENNYGNFAVVRDALGNRHQYSHLHQSYVKPGDRVKRGKPIATMGDTGSAYSPSGGDATHLDYRVASAYGKIKNPMTYLKGFL